MVKAAAQAIGILVVIMWWVFYLAISKSLPALGVLPNVLAVLMGPFFGLAVYVSMMRN